MTQRDVVFPQDARRFMSATAIPGDQANGFLFVSGQVGSREDGSPEPDLKNRCGWRSATSTPCWPPPAAASTTWST